MRPNVARNQKTAVPDMTIAATPATSTRVDQMSIHPESCLVERPRKPGAELAEPKTESGRIRISSPPMQWSAELIRTGSAWARAFSNSKTTYRIK